MNSNKDISHKGRVLEVTPQFTTVEIISESACSACHAKGLCSLSDSKAKTVMVPTSGWDSFSPGDEVNVVLKLTMGYKAVWLAYVVPLFVLVVVLLGLVAAGVKDIYAGMGAIGAVALYYSVIFLLRSKLNNQYIFKLEK